MSFEVAIGRVLGNEGGYVNNPEDAGGETQWGISKRSYPNVDIKALTRDQAVEIYRRDFWQRVHGDELPTALGYQALDFAVHSGVETSIRKMQTAAGVADDGHWGPVTRAAVSKANPYAITARLVAERLDFLRHTAAWQSFNNGFAARIAADLRLAATDFEGATNA